MKKKNISTLLIISVVAANIFTNTVAVAATGATLMKDFIPGVDSGDPHGMTLVGGYGYFYADNDDDGKEIWRTDGTALGTNMIKDINPGAADGINIFSGQFVGSIYNRVYFAGDDGVNGQELWKSDGTEEGTVMVADINPEDSSNPRNFTTVDETLYFTADDGDGGELWKTDGTEEGTVMVSDAPTDLSRLVALDNDTLIFFAGDGGTAQEIWKSDGTEEGTVMVEDIYAGDGTPLAQHLTVINGVLYFAADDGVNGRELWKTDGTAEGTRIVKDIDTDEGESVNPFSLANLNGTLFFMIDNDDLGQELWKSDGTEGGTVLVKHVEDSSHPLQNLVETEVVEDILYFSAYNHPESDNQLWKTDGTEEGTVLVRSMGLGMPTGLTSTYGILYFAYNDWENGEEVWRTDGTEEGTVLVADVNEDNFIPAEFFEDCIDPEDPETCFTVDNPEEGSSFPTELTILYDNLIFNADDGNTGGHGYELWSIDLPFNADPVLGSFSADFEGEDVDLVLDVDDPEDENLNITYHYGEREEGEECDPFVDQHQATIVSASDDDSNLIIDDNTITGVNTSGGGNSVDAVWDTEADLGNETGSYCVYAYANDGRGDSQPLVASFFLDVEAFQGGGGGGGAGGGGGGGGGSVSRLFTVNVNSENEGETTIGETTSTTSNAAFPDTAGHWADSYIKNLKALGIVNGKTATSFDPDGGVTRAELLKMSLNAFGVQLMTPTATSFSDVKLTDWFAGFVETAVEKEFVNGYSDGTFRPNQTVTRAEALVIIFRTAQFDLSVAPDHVFPDTTASAWYAEFVSFAVEEGIVSGYGNGNFGPNDSLTRAQAAKIITLAMELN